MTDQELYVMRLERTLREARSVMHDVLELCAEHMIFKPETYPVREAGEGVIIRRGRRMKRADDAYLWR